ncbi:hypothetical protein [Candidatus Nitrosotalea bavarica]|uniref:hypothetical protein n=1 Tax=Candidatus Nitrosotalea bavarica TaxID=1903277 RepID=UPI0010557630|nr:hypothetical protein [Candidatus Nitrosotalea bavarica]
MNSKLVKATSALTLFVLMASVVASSAPAFALNGHGTTYGRGPQFGGGTGITASGGAYLTYDDGLSINGASFDISKFTTTINTQTLYVNMPSDITFKIYEHDGVQLIQHGALFLGITGTHPQVSQSTTFIQWDKTSGVSTSDPNGLFKSATATVKYSGKFMYLTFHITPAQTLDTSHIIVRAWDENLSQGQVIVLDAIKIGYIPNGFSGTSQ